MSSILRKVADLVRAELNSNNKDSDPNQITQIERETILLQMQREDESKWKTLEIEAAATERARLDYQREKIQEAKDLENKIAQSKEIDRINRLELLRGLSPQKSVEYSKIDNYDQLLVEIAKDKSLEKSKSTIDFDPLVEFESMKDQLHKFVIQTNRENQTNLIEDLLISVSQNPLYSEINDKNSLTTLLAELTSNSTDRSLSSLECDPMQDLKSQLSNNPTISKDNQYDLNSLRTQLTLEPKKNPLEDLKREMSF